MSFSKIGKLWRWRWIGYLYFISHIYLLEVQDLHTHLNIGKGWCIEEYRGTMEISPEVEL
jgi:hypothetical protein